MLQLVEGFDHYNSVALATVKGWSILGIGSGQWAATWVPGRINGQAFSATTLVNPPASNLALGVTKTLPTTLTSLSCGFAFRTSAMPMVGQSGWLYQAVTVTGALVFGVKVSQLGQVQLFPASGTNLNSALNLVTANVWHYCEVKAVIAGGSSTVEVWLDGVQVIPSTAVNLGSAGVTTIGPYGNAGSGANWVGGTNITQSWDDLYVTDTAGVNAGLLGDVHVDTLYPIGDGANTAWAPDAGTSHYQRVSDNPPDGDTSYVSSGTVGAKDSYSFSDLPAGTGPVYGVQVNLWARKDDAAVRQLSPLVRIAGTDYLGAAQTLASSYADLTQLYDRSPASSSAWTPAEVNAAEFGVEVAA
jgi:hypothetical protein